MTQDELIKLKELYPEYAGRKAHNAVDLSGQLKGQLLILYRTLNKENVSITNRAQWVCECQCKNKTICIKSGSSLNNGHTTSCGCERGNKTKEFEPGQTFGFWKIIARVPNKNNFSVYYKCKCLKCGTTEAEVSRHLLVSGESTACQKCRQKAMVEATIKNEQGKTYGFLYVERRATEEETPLLNHGVYWNCTCQKCGRTNVIIKGDYLRNGDTKSCGCILSINESKIACLLDNYGYKYKSQYTFSNLSSTGRSCDRLPFDFAILNDKQEVLYLIEYDGIQHFNKNHQWFDGGFEKTRQNDLLKNQYCFTNNIPLIRIPFDTKYTLEDLQLETTHFLLTPENEEEYYKKS